MINEKLIYLIKGAPSSLTSFRTSGTLCLLEITKKDQYKSLPKEKQKRLNVLNLLNKQKFFIRVSRCYCLRTN